VISVAALRIKACTGDNRTDILPSFRKNLSQNDAKYYVLAEIYYTNSPLSVLPLPIFFGRTAFNALEPPGEVPQKKYTQAYSE